MKSDRARDRFERRRKKARSGLVRLIKRLRKGCGSFGGASDWISFVKDEVLPLLEKYADVINVENRQQIVEASRVVDSTPAGIHQACRSLESVLERTVLWLPAPAPVPLAQVMVGGFMAVGGLLAAGILALNLLAADLRIVNNGCSPIDMSAYQFMNQVPGMQVPEVIEPGSEDVLTVAPLSIVIDTSQEEQLTFNALGIPVTGQVDDLTSIRLDQSKEILGLDFPLALKPRSEHTLELICR